MEVELRAVNGRGLNLRPRLPAGLDEHEHEVRNVVEGRVGRGTVNLTVTVEESGKEVELELDRERVEAYLEAFRRLREAYALPGQVDLPLLVRSGEILRERRRESYEWLSLELVRQPLEEALDQLVEMRRQEGKRLAEDLRGRLAEIEAHLDAVEELAPERLERERERLRRSAAELLDDAEVDEDRLAQEIALLADKWDVGEEVSRARSHLQGFRDLMEAADEDPVGRRLKFLCQELHREINTAGAKGNDAEISRHVVEMKNELEAIKEQVENVE